MLKFCYLSASLTIAAVLLPTIAPAQERDTPLCYMQTQTGRLLNLSALCGPASKTSLPPAKPDVRVSQLEYKGGLLVGQVTNQTGKSVKGVTVNYVIVDAQGNELGAGMAKSLAASIRPGGSARFQDLSGYPQGQVKVLSVDWES